MLNKLALALSDGFIGIPTLLFNNYKKLNIADNEFIVLMYLINNKSSFNPKEISNILDVRVNEVLEIINSLTEKDLITLKLVTVNGLKEEMYDVSNLYKKLSFLIVNDKKEDDIKSDIFSIFEKEFGRTLSPIEYELIRGWLDNGFEEDIIIEALKEAVFNGVTNLRYIDKILFEWHKKGIKKVSDIKSLKLKKNDKNVNNNAFDYDWLSES